MQPAGGLKLKLTGATRDDRRVRVAQLTVSKVEDGHDISLVTDSGGQLRYRLPEGEYRLRLESGQEAGFAVHDARWTTVRLQLP